MTRATCSRVSSGADDQARVIAVDDTVVVEISVEPAVGSGGLAVVTEADCEADVVGVDDAVEVLVAD